MSERPIAGPMPLGAGPEVSQPRSSLMRVTSALPTCPEVNGMAPVPDIGRMWHLPEASACRRAEISASPGLAVPVIENDSFDSDTILSPMLSLENRSEEHTSELQSRFDLVCRLLLEKKKYYILIDGLHC